MSIIKKGIGIAFAGYGFVRWVKGQGTVMGATYNCATETEAMGVMQSLKASFTQVEAHQVGEGPGWQVTGSFSGDEDNPEESIVDTHELDGGEQQNDLRFAPVLLAKLTDGSFDASARVAYVDALVKNTDKSRTESYAMISASTDPTFPGVMDGIARQLYDDLIANNDRVEVSVYDYVHTYTIGSNGVHTLNTNNINCIFASRADLLSSEGIDLPPGFVLPEGEWRKRAPKLISQYGQRTQAVYRYAWAESWDRNRYNAAS